MDEYFPIIDENINPCRGCPDYDEDGSKSNGGCGRPQTNADRIRTMSDEELAEWIASIYPDCPPGREGCINDTDVCQSCWLDWLRQEASDG